MYKAFTRVLTLNFKGKEHKQEGLFCMLNSVYFIRSNKSLPTPFVVIILDPIPDGTKVTVAAGNEENCCADVKNNVTEINSQIARFSDLRFVGKSGRGKLCSTHILRVMK